MMYSQAAKVSPRCAAATATSTMGAELDAADAVDHRRIQERPARALVTMCASARSVIPG